MKNKKLLYFLLPAVLIIWGMIIIKVISWMNEDKQELVLPNSMVRKSLSNTVKDTFSVILNYPDPFGLHPAFFKKPSIQKSNIDKEKKRPTISFYGIVSSGKKKSPLACIKINGSDMIMKPGETYDGVRLVACKGGSVVVNYHGDVYEIVSENVKR